MTASKLLVAGASGHLGRRVVERLVETGAGRVIATTRTPERLADLAAKGVEVRRADHDDPSTLSGAFAGAGRMLLISGSDLGKRRAQQRAAVEAAVAAGVQHILYTSAPAARPDPQNPLLDSHYWTEQALAASPVGWTVLRNNIYAEVILMGLPQAVASGQLFSATGGKGRSYVTREDCARVAAAALASDFAGRRILDVTGPAPVTQEEVAAIAGNLAGKKVVHVALTPEDLRAGMAAVGLPELFASVLVAFDVDAAQGYHAIVTPVVEALTGVKPTAVRDFLAANRVAFAGEPALA